LASIEGEEERERRKMKQAAVGGLAVAATVGIAAGIASMLLHKR